MRLGWAELRDFRNHAFTRVEDLPEGLLVAVGPNGEVAVTYLATLFKKIRLHTHENIGWGKIRLPQDDMHTGAFWLALPPDLLDPGAAEAALQGDAARVQVNDAALRIEASARQALAAIVDGDTLRTMMAGLRRLFRQMPVNTVVLRQRLADAAVARGAYPF